MKHSNPHFGQNREYCFITSSLTAM